MCDTGLRGGPELPLPCHTHNTKCSWNTGFLLSGTVFVFCLHFQSASGTMDIFGRKTSVVLTLPKHCRGWRLARPLVWMAELKEPMLRLVGITSHFCLSGNCVTKLLRAGEGGRRAEKSRSDAHKCGWLGSDSHPLSGELLPALCTSQQETHPSQQTSPPAFGHPLGRSCNKWLTQPSAESCPPLCYFMQGLTTKPMSKSPARSLHAGWRRKGKGQSAEQAWRSQPQNSPQKAQSSLSKAPGEEPTFT